MIRIRVDLPGEVQFIDIINHGPVLGWPESDGIYSQYNGEYAPPVPDLFHYKVRSEAGTRFFTHIRTRGWKQCVIAALEAMA